MLMKKGLPKKVQYLSPNSIGASYALGEEGLPKNLNKALFWYKVGAIQGDFIAQCNLAQMYFDGDVYQCYPLAKKWFALSADQGDGQAMYFLGEIHRKGLGVKVDHQIAAYWYKKALNDGWPIHDASEWLKNFESKNQRGRFD